MDLYENAWRQGFMINKEMELDFARNCIPCINLHVRYCARSAGAPVDLQIKDTQRKFRLQHALILKWEN